MRTLYDRRQKARVRDAFSKVVDRYLGEKWGGVCSAMVREAESGSVPAAEWIRKLLRKGMDRDPTDSSPIIVLRPYPALVAENKSNSGDPGDAP